MLNLASFPGFCNAALLDHLPDAIILFDDQGKPLAGNQSAIRWLWPYLPALIAIDSSQVYHLLDRHHCPLAPDQLPLQRLLAGETLEHEEYILVQSGATDVQRVALSGSLCSPALPQPLAWPVSYRFATSLCPGSETLTTSSQRTI